MANMTRRGFIAAITLLLAGCGNSKSASSTATVSSVTEETDTSSTTSDTSPVVTQEPKQIVDKTTNYDVLRCDWRDGVMGDVTVYTVNNMDFSGSYGVLQPDGTFNCEINGVPYNGVISLGKETTHLYSGQEDAKVTQLLFDGKSDATVGDVLIAGYAVDGVLLIEMTTQVDKKTVMATFYLFESIGESE